jgi:poly(hydroxyalkanoate) depolymerase family esterase
MTNSMTELMNRAAALTRSGDLQRATALIQEALRPQQRASAASPFSQGDVIDVVARELAGGLEPSPPPSPGVPSAEPPAREGTFLRGVHAAVGMRCDYRLFLPHELSRGAPLVVMLHGCTQTPEDFALGTRMNEVAGARGCAVLYPAQSIKMNPQRCWNWFKRQHQTRERGEPALLESVIRAVVSEHGFDASRVFVAGLSAGGAMAAVLADACPDLVAAVGVHSGLPAGAARDLPAGLSAMKTGPGAGFEGNGAGRRVPCIVFHGDADATVNCRNGEVLARAIPHVSARQSRVDARAGGRPATRTVFLDDDGRTTGEQWVVHGAPHAWSGGSPNGSYTDPRGPDASAEMMRFFLDRR